MIKPTISLTREAMTSSGIGVIFMAAFGMLWANTGLMGMQGLGSPFLLIIVSFISVLLLLGGLSFLRISRRLPRETTDSRHGKRVRFWFNVVFATEGLAIGIAIAVCNITHHSEFIPPVIALIVGLHFFPLAPLFHVKTYYITGGLLSILAIITMFTIPITATFGEHEIITWWAVIGFGSALILWATGLVVWLQSKKWLKA